jgi:hypothetical protein
MIFEEEPTGILLLVGMMALAAGAAIREAFRHFRHRHRRHRMRIHF